MESVIASMGLVALASILVGVLALGMGIAYAISPSEQRLMLLRPLSLAAVFAGLSGMVGGFVFELSFLAARPERISFSPQVAAATAESLFPLFSNVGCLTAAWLCVALGMWRRPQ